ncbi:MAG: ATPase, T2SS/T4P/T4SS family [Nitriliruptoraceae bacterium]
MPSTTPVISPLLEIEQAVLSRAMDEHLDIDDDRTGPRLKELLRAEIDQWHIDFQHGRRYHDIADPHALMIRAERDLLGYGPLQSLLDDDDVWEVMVNAPDQIFVRRHQGHHGYHDESFHDRDHVVRTLTRLLHDSSGSHRKLDPAEGLQDAQLDDGARLHIVHAEVGRGSNLLVNIRKFTGVAFRSLDELVNQAMMPPEVADLLRAAVRARLSIIIAGPPGAGKTTLLSCCAAELDPVLRVVTAEEVFEVDVPLPNVASMQTRSARPGRPAVDLRRLVAGFLRMAPDVAIVGEVRDQEALPLLLTLSSGVTGYTTIHAGSAVQALSRLRFVCQLADTRSELPLVALNALVVDAVDVVVHCDRVNGVPRLRQVAAVEAMEDVSHPTLPVSMLYDEGWTGVRPTRALAALTAAGWSPPSQDPIHDATQAASR